MAKTLKNTSRFHTKSHVESMSAKRPFLSSLRTTLSRLGGALSGHHQDSLRTYKHMTDFHKKSVERSRNRPAFQHPRIPKIIRPPEEVCKERKERREVIFAKNKQGGSHKPAKYTIDSYVRCK